MYHSVILFLSNNSLCLTTPIFTVVNVYLTKFKTHLFICSCRRAAEDQLHRFLDNSSITHGMAEHIVSADVNDAFLEAVMSLSDKLKYLQQEMPASDGSSLDIPPSETFAGRSLLPDLEKLKLKAITKARDYFLLQFQAIRKPKTNVQMVQQNSLCKYAPLLQFVQREAPSAAEDLRYDFIS